MGECLNIYDCMLNCIRKYPAFEFYQTHTWGGKIIIDGIMGDEKNSYISIDDIKEKIILDLGCATGATCLWAAENGAKHVIGIDKEHLNIQIFNELAGIAGCSHNTYVYDLKYKLPEKIIDTKIDTVFCFAITQYIGYRKIWEEVPSAKVVYIMGGVDSNYTEENLSDDLYKAEFLTNLPNNRIDRKMLRKLFRLEKRSNG